MSILSILQDYRYPIHASLCRPYPLVHQYSCFGKRPLGPSDITATYGLTTHRYAYLGCELPNAGKGNILLEFYQSFRILSLLYQRYCM